MCLGRQAKGVGGRARRQLAAAHAAGRRCMQGAHRPIGIVPALGPGSFKRNASRCCPTPSHTSPPAAHQHAGRPPSSGSSTAMAGKGGKGLREQACTTRGVHTAGARPRSSADPPRRCLLQDLATLDATKLTPLSPEVISRQATINIGGRACRPPWGAARDGLVCSAGLPANAAMQAGPDGQRRTSSGSGSGGGGGSCERGQAA